MSTFNPDAGIPLLTEIIQAPQHAEGEPSAPPPAAAVQPADASEPAAPTDTGHWERLEQELQERVLQQVFRRIDAVLEQRVRDGLADVLQTAVEDLAHQVRQSLHQTL